MKIMSLKTRRCLIALAIAGILPLSAQANGKQADEKYELLQQQVSALQQQLQEVQAALQEYQQQMTVKEGQVEEAVTAMKKDVAEAAEWKHPDTLIHMSGYADVGYTGSSGGDGSFAVGRFAPIFHFQYRDKVMLEAELEVEVNGQGETEVGMEYLTIDYFLNDYVALVAGKFLSPIGQFRQNIHPSWINKLASAPPGFGHDGAAPAADVGMQARGGFQIGEMFTNYAAFISNGPELNSVFDGDEYELEGIVAEGQSADADGEKVIGGRFGIMPLSGMEIGFSLATGKATVTALEIAHGDEGRQIYQSFSQPGLLDVTGGAEEGPDLHAEQARDYDVLGMDFVWGKGNLQLRGEYVRSKIGAATAGLTASPGATWESWYTQVAYLIPQTKFEPVIRYTDFDSPHSSQDQQQWGLGLNYLISNNVMGKATYEFNSGQAGSLADSNRWLLQLAYGF